MVDILEILSKIKHTDFIKLTPVEMCRIVTEKSTFKHKRGPYLDTDKISVGGFFTYVASIKHPEYNDKHFDVRVYLEPYLPGCLHVVLLGTLNRFSSTASGGARAQSETAVRVILAMILGNLEPEPECDTSDYKRRFQDA